MRPLSLSDSQQAHLSARVIYVHDPNLYPDEGIYVGFASAPVISGSSRLITMVRRFGTPRGSSASFIKSFW